jgi:hypothetical protein
MPDKTVPVTMEKPISPYVAALNSVRGSTDELVALLDAGRGSLADIREAASRLEGAESTFRPRYLVSVKTLSLEENKTAVDALEAAREAAHRAAMRTNLAMK